MGVRTSLSRPGRARGAWIVPVVAVALGCGGQHGASGSGAAPPPEARVAPVLDADVVSAGAVSPTGGTLTNPDAGDPRAAQAGAQIFSAMNCDGCHGGGATGWVGPSLVDGRWRYGGADGNLFQSIYFGRPRGMPAYGGLLAPTAIWRLVTYLRSQPLPPDVPTESWVGGNR